jgi:hypothetical protein
MATVASSAATVTVIPERARSGRLLRTWWRTRLRFLSYSHDGADAQ